jgi:GNAT superfamily N-acetyltransferase
MQHSSREQHPGFPVPPVRRAAPGDAPAILRLVDALAAYERLVPPDEAARKRLVHDLFCERPRMEAYLCEVDAAPAGYAFIFETYSSFLALPTFYLEDLFVLPEYRKRRAGYALFTAMAAEARRRGCGRMEWMVLDWNRLALDFYGRFEARHMKEWCLLRLDREQLSTIPE